MGSCYPRKGKRTKILRKPKRTKWTVLDGLAQAFRLFASSFFAVDENRTQTQFLPGRSFEVRLTVPKDISWHETATDILVIDAFLQCHNRLRLPPPSTCIRLANLS
jgi:hypothetical protein